MKILYVGGEALPYASTGGLGDVLGSLPAALKAYSPEDDVRLVMPLHGKISPEWREKMTKVTEFTVQLAWRCQYCGVWSLEKDGVTVYFIDNEYYFKRPRIYGEYDDGERYAFFSLAVMEMMEKIGYVPDILHANDWQAALTVLYAKVRFPDYGIKTVYTIHNIEYQGVFNKDILGEVFALPDSALSLVEFDGCVNLTKGAIVACDKLTTVSQRYSEELRTPYYASGLDGIIGENAYKSCGIVNGIDISYYDPMHDPDMIGPKFGSKYKLFSNKTANKTALQEALGLPVDENIPMVSMITRLVSHKGVDLVKHVIDQVLGEDVQFVLLGTGNAEFEDFFRWLESRYPNKVRALIRFDKKLSKQIYAASDLFLMPSKSEPCGLSQMIASRYGAIPIVRETGGLYDTIKPFNPETGEGNGVTFYSYNAHDMLDAIRRALALWQDENTRKKLVRNAITADFSWNASAAKYADLYKSM